MINLTDECLNINAFIHMTDRTDPELCEFEFEFGFELLGVWLCLWYLLRVGQMLCCCVGGVEEFLLLVCFGCGC